MAATDIREVLGKYVPSAVLDQAVDEIKSTEIAPEWFRSEAASTGKKVKELEAELSELRPYKEAPQRKAALEKFGHDYEASPKYLKSVFDAIPADKLGDEDYVSQHLRDNDVEVRQTQTVVEGERPAAANIVDHAVNANTRSPGQESYEQAVNAAQSQEDMDAVYARFGKQPATT